MLLGLQRRTGSVAAGNVHCWGNHCQETALRDRGTLVCKPASPTSSLMFTVWAWLDGMDACLPPCAQAGSPAAGEWHSAWSVFCMAGVTGWVHGALHWRRGACLTHWTVANDFCIANMPHMRWNLCTWHHCCLEGGMGGMLARPGDWWIGPVADGVLHLLCEAFTALNDKN